MSRKEWNEKKKELERARRNLLCYAEFVSDMDAYVVPALYLDSVRNLQRECDDLFFKVLEEEVIPYTRTKKINRMVRFAEVEEKNRMARFVEIEKMSQNVRRLWAEMVNAKP